MRCAPAVLLASLLCWIGLPAGAQDSPGTDVFEAHESPEDAMQRMQKAKKRPLRRGGGTDAPVHAPYLPDESVRSSGASAPAAVDFSGSHGHGRDNDHGKDLDRAGTGADDKEPKDKDRDHDAGHDDDRDDDDVDDDGGKKKGKG